MASVEETWFSLSSDGTGDLAASSLRSFLLQGLSMSSKAAFDGEGLRVTVSCSPTLPLCTVFHAGNTHTLLQTSIFSLEIRAQLVQFLRDVAGQIRATRVENIVGQPPSSVRDCLQRLLTNCIPDFSASRDKYYRCWSYCTTEYSGHPEAFYAARVELSIGGQNFVAITDWCYKSMRAAEEAACSQILDKGVNHKVNTGPSVLQVLQSSFSNTLQLQLALVGHHSANRAYSLLPSDVIETTALQSLLALLPNTEIWFEAAEVLPLQLGGIVDCKRPGYPYPRPDLPARTGRRKPRGFDKPAKRIPFTMFCYTGTLFVRTSGKPILHFSVERQTFTSIYAAQRAAVALALSTTLVPSLLEAYSASSSISSVLRYFPCDPPQVETPPASTSSPMLLDDVRECHQPDEASTVEADHTIRYPYTRNPLLLQLRARKKHRQRETRDYTAEKEQRLGRFLNDIPLSTNRSTGMDFNDDNTSITINDLRQTRNLSELRSLRRVKLEKVQYLHLKRWQLCTDAELHELNVQPYVTEQHLLQVLQNLTYLSSLVVESATFFPTLPYLAAWPSIGMQNSLTVCSLSNLPLIVIWPFLESLASLEDLDLRNCLARRRLGFLEYWRIDRRSLEAEGNVFHARSARSEFALRNLRISETSSSFLADELCIPFLEWILAVPKANLQLAYAVDRLGVTGYHRESFWTGTEFVRTHFSFAETVEDRKRLNSRGGVAATKHEPYDRFSHLTGATQPAPDSRDIYWSDDLLLETLHISGVSQEIYQMVASKLASPEVGLHELIKQSRSAALLAAYEECSSEEEKRTLQEFMIKKPLVSNKTKILEIVSSTLQRFR